MITGNELLGGELRSAALSVVLLSPERHQVLPENMLYWLFISSAHNTSLYAALHHDPAPIPTALMNIIQSRYGLSYPVAVARFRQEPLEGVVLYVLPRETPRFPDKWSRRVFSTPLQLLQQFGM
jgi:hypothetical protein